MAQVAVVTDSIACLPEELTQRYGIYIVPLSFAFEDRVYRDGVDITPTQFYRLLKKANKFPTTSAPPPSAYLEAYRAQSQLSSTILCITLSRKLSMAFDSALQAKELAREELPETTIEVLDSESAAGSQGFVALAAARAASSGADLAQVMEATRGVMSRVEILGLMDTLYYVAKGGHVPKVAAWTASFFSIKPILGIKSDEVKLVARVRTKSRAVKRLLDIMKERVNQDPVHVSVMHADALEEAQKLRDRVANQFNCVELFITDFTPVMGVHTGPGVLALAFYSEG